MVKTITVGNKTLTVQQVYPYQYNFGAGKQVLRIDILKSDHGYDAIAAALESPAGDIVYIEDGAAVCTYKGYTRNFQCNYSSAAGLYSVEIDQVTQAELDITQLQTQVAALGQQVVTLSLGGTVS